MPNPLLASEATSEERGAFRRDVIEFRLQHSIYSFNYHANTLIAFAIIGRHYNYVTLITERVGR